MKSQLRKDRTTGRLTEINSDSDHREPLTLEMNYVSLDVDCHLNIGLENELPSNDYMERRKDIRITADAPGMISDKIVPNSVVQFSDNENSTTEIAKHTRDVLSQIGKF